MSRPQSTLKSQRGFSMIAVLIAAAIGAVIMGGLLESVILMIRSQRSSEVSNLSNLAVDQIQAVLSSDAACTAAFATSIPVLNINSSNFTPVLTLADVPVHLAPGAELLKGVNLQDYQILDSGLPVTTFKLNGVPQIRRIVTLRLSTVKANKDLFSPAHRARDINLDMIVDATGKILGCVAENEETKTCEEGGGIWDPLAPLGQKCVPYRYCEWGGSFANAPANVGGFPNQLTGGYNCPSAEYIQQQTGTIATAKRSGKTHVYNDLQPIYTCMKCGAAAAPQSASVTQVDAGLDSALQDYDTSSSQNATDAAAVHAAQCSAGTGPCP